MSEPGEDGSEILEVPAEPLDVLLLVLLGWKDLHADGEWEVGPGGEGDRDGAIIPPNFRYRRQSRVGIFWASNRAGFSSSYL